MDQNFKHWSLTSGPKNRRKTQKELNDEFEQTSFFHSEKSGRSITADPDKIFTQTF